MNIRVVKVINNTHYLTDYTFTEVSHELEDTMQQLIKQKDVDIVQSYNNTKLISWIGKGMNIVRYTDYGKSLV